MATNPFLASNPYTAMNPYSGVQSSPEDYKRGILGTLVHEIGADIVGAGKVIGATALSPFTLFSDNVPVTFDDIGKRDVQGAAAIASMLVSGGVATGLKATAIGAKASGTALGRAGMTAGIEGAGGAFFGALTPEADESIIESAAENAALFAGIGAGASGIKSAYKATVGASLAGVKRAKARSELAGVAERFETEQMAREMVGTRLYNPNTASYATLLRNSKNKVVYAEWLPKNTSADRRHFVSRILPGAFPETGPLKGLSPNPMGAPKSATLPLPPLGEGVQPENVQSAWNWVSARYPRLVERIERIETTSVPGRKAAWNETDKTLKVAVDKELSVDELVHEITHVAQGARGKLNISTREDLAEIEAYARRSQLAALAGKGSELKKSDVLRTKSRAFSSFNEAITHARANGFVENLGPVRTRKLKGTIIGDDLLANAIDEHPDGVLGVLGKLELEDYKAWKVASVERQEAADELTHLAAELIAPADGFGAPALGEKTRKDLLAEAGLATFDATKMSDADVIRTLVKKGMVDPQSLQAGQSQRDFVKQLFINDAVPDGSLTLVSRNTDSFLTSFLTPTTVAKIHPEVIQLVKDADNRLANMQHGQERTFERLHPLRTTVSIEKAKRAVEIIDESSQMLDGSLDDSAAKVAAAREWAIQQATATGDQEILQFVTEAQDMLGSYLQRAQDAGALTEGLAGYFPIFNIGQWKLEVNRGGKATFEGFYTSKQEALEAMERVKASDPTAKGATILPKKVNFEGDGSVLMEPRQMAALAKAVKAASTEEITWKEAREVAGEFARIDLGPLKGAPSLKKRTLGIRDFAKDPYEALEIYTNTMERMLAFRDFGRSADALIEQIPTTKPRLKRWAEQYRDDLLGRPRESEQVFQNMMEWIAETSGGKMPVPERALSNYAAGLRRWETFSRLGGFFSGIVNTTQVAINTYPVLGAKYTAKGLEILDPRKFKEVASFFEKAGADLELFVPFTEAGGSPIFSTVRGAIKEKKHLEAVERIALFTFNGAEKINRLATAWGAYNKGIADGMTKDLAIEYARETVQRTQFNYRLSNTPEILRGPIGATLGQFKQFFINEVEFIGSLSKAEAARFGAALWSMGGLAVLFNAPGPDLADAATGMFADKKLSESLKIAPDSRLAKMAVFGIPGGMLNVDLSDYVGIGSLADVTRGLLGPGPQDVLNFTRFAYDGTREIATHGAVSNDTKNAFLQRAYPSAMRRALRGYAIARNDEIRNPYTNKLLYKPEGRLRMAMTAGIGAPEIEQTQERVMDEVTTRVRERYVQARSSYAKEAALAMRSGRQAEAQEILMEARSAGYTIDQRTLGYWMQELGKTGDERRERRLPVELRAQYAELFGGE